MSMAATSPPAAGGGSGAVGRGLRADSEDSDFGDDALSEDEYVTRRLQKIMGAAAAERIDELADVESGGGVTQSARTALERLQALSLEAPPVPSADDALVGDDAALSLPASFFEDDDADDDQDDAYVITWEGGQLGLLFKASPAQQVVIRRVNKQGTALGLHLARAGDVLVGLNGVSVQGVPFLEIIEQLKNPRFPIKLEFEPIKFGALPFGLASVSGAATPLPPPPPYAAFSAANVAPPQPQMASPTSSSGTVEVTDYDSSFVMVPRPQPDPSVSRMMDRSRPEYDVVWDEGPLGCGLKHRNGFPTVKTMSTVGVSASVAQISAGDVLTVINGYKTHEIGFKSAITMLQRAPKPIYLRFRRQAPLPTQQQQPLKPSVAVSDSAPRGPAASTLAPFQYSVLWADGPLGIQIKAGGGDGRVYVSRLTGAGNPTMTAQITPGDIFVRIADVDVASRGLAGAFELLKSVQKPVLLVFEKPAKTPESGATLLPSFRRLREEAAVREKIAAHGASGGHPHGLTRTQSAGSRGNGRHLLHPHDGGFDGEENSWQTRTAPYPSSSQTADSSIRPQLPASSMSTRTLDLKFDFDDRSDTGSQQSNARTEYSQPQGAVGDDASSDLPRFSDIEAGRVAVTPELSALPPPPSYLEMFTQSGRSLDTIHSTRAAPGSPLHSDSVSMSSEQHSDRYAVPPSPLMPMHSSAPQSGYSLPPPPLAPQESDAFAALPPPPQYSSFFPPSDGSSRLEELRQQYIEAQRAHNQPQFSSTMMSSYSDLDDSGVMRERPYPSAPRAPQMQPLPLPELWVRWSDGPLGITFKRKNGRIVVSRLTGAGLSPGLEQLRTGDWLVSFNRQSTETLRLSETMELLKRLPKPIDMRFVVQ